MPFAAHLFREYDLRGKADAFTPQLLFALGQALATLAQTAATAQGRPRQVVLAHDCRLHSPRIVRELCAGLRTGIEVIELGMGPTPYAYFVDAQLRPAATIMITGSHNPADENGLKLVLASKPLYGEALQALAQATRARMLQPDGATPRHAATPNNLQAAYLAALLSRLSIEPAAARQHAIVLDAGNGTGGPLGLQTYEALGFQVHPLYCEPDGAFPHHHPDPTVPDNLVALIAEVRRTNASLGLAFDGDADRLGVVDRQGRIVWGDQLLAVLGTPLAARHPGAVILGEVKCSQTTFDVLTAAGARPVMCPVGHSLIKARMKETGALLAGELSGHLFFADRWFGFDDAIYAGGRVLELLVQGNLDGALAALPVLARTPEVRRACPEGDKPATVARATKFLQAHPDVRDVITIDGVRARFAEGWGLIRASNTEAVLVLRAEASTAAALETICAVLEAALAT